MRPERHVKLVHMSPLAGIGFLVLATTTLGLLRERELMPYLLVTVAAILLALGGWIYSRWFLVVECPECSTRIRMKVDESSVIYRCQACGSHTTFKRVSIDAGPIA